MELHAREIGCRFFRNGKGTNYFYAVQHVSLSLRAGTLTEIAGRSGSGKSTLLNCMAGLLAPTEGGVLLDETDLYALPDEARSLLRGAHIGVIPQNQAALSALTVLENVRLPAMIAGMEIPADRDMELLERVGIAHLKDVYPDALSGGELRRLSIARALMRDPDVLLADEPTGDLDDDNTAVVLQLLRACADEGKAVLLVTHEREADAYADEIYRMAEGVLSKEAASG